MRDERFYISGAGQVSDAEIYLRARLLTDLVCHRRESLLIAAGDHDARAFAGELRGYGPANSLARRRHQRDLAFQTEVQNLPPHREIQDNTRGLPPHRNG